MSNSNNVSGVISNNGLMRQIQLVIPVLNGGSYDQVLGQLKTQLEGYLKEVALQYKQDITVLHVLDPKVEDGYPCNGFWSAVLIGAGFDGRTLGIAVETPVCLTYDVPSKKPTANEINLMVDRLIERVRQRALPYIEGMLKA